MKYLAAVVALYAVSCAKPAPVTTLGPRVILLDDSLVGQTQDALEERFGKPCYETKDGIAWNALQNSVMSCAVPTGQLLAVYMRDGSSVGYYLGEWFR